MNNLSYLGDRARFNIEGCYKRLIEDFTDLSHAGPSHYLNEHQRVINVENSLQNNSAIRYHIDAKNEWYALPVPEQTFNKFYNLLSANFSKFKYMIG